jgi:hypothetical protein
LFSHSRAGGNPRQGNLRPKYVQKSAGDLDFYRRKTDICAVNHFHRVEVIVEKDAALESMFLRFFSVMIEPPQLGGIPYEAVCF